MNRVVRGQNMKLALVSDSGLQLGTVFPLLESRQVIGRRLDANIPIDDTRVSRDHALVDFRNGFYYLVDLGSTNGTYINGRRVQHAVRLQLGDHLRVGSSVFKVELVRRAAQKASRNWHDPTCVELDAFVAEQDSVASSVEASEQIIHQSQEVSAPSLGRVLSASIPRWLYLIERDPSKNLSKRQGLMLMLLLCSLIVLSAIFVGLSTPAA